MAELFCTAYCGPLSYYAALLRSTDPRVHLGEKWEKQSYRNRCYIDSPGGRLMLNIPIDHQSNKESMAEVRISYRQKWHLEHWQAIKTSYGSSPFFEVLGEDIRSILFSETEYLYQLNAKLMNFFLRSLQLPVVKGELNIDVSAARDLRAAFHPKVESANHFPPYPQVFDHKHPFIPNLSIMDLLFNEGPAAYDYLKKL